MGPRGRHIYRSMLRKKKEPFPYTAIEVWKIKKFLLSNKHKMGKIIKLNHSNLPVKVLIAQQDGNLGVENIKVVITVVTTFFVDFITILKNKDYINLISLVFNLVRQGNIIALAKTAWLEIKDTSLTESNDIHKHFASVLELSDKKTEKLIEEAFELIPQAYELALQGMALFGDVKGFANKATNIFKGKLTDVEDVQTDLLLAA